MKKGVVIPFTLQGSLVKTTSCRFLPPISQIFLEKKLRTDGMSISLPYGVSGLLFVRLFFGSLVLVSRSQPR